MLALAVDNQSTMSIIAHLIQEFGCLYCLKSESLLYMHLTLAAACFWLLWCGVKRLFSGIVALYSENRNEFERFQVCFILCIPGLEVHQISACPALPNQTALRFLILQNNAVCCHYLRIMSVS